MAPKRPSQPIPLSTFLSEGSDAPPGERLPSGPGEGSATPEVGSRRWIADWSTKDIYAGGGSGRGGRSHIRHRY